MATQDTAVTQDESSHVATLVHPPANPVENSEHYRTRTGRVSKPVDRLPYILAYKSLLRISRPLKIEWVCCPKSLNRV